MSELVLGRDICGEAHSSRFLVTPAFDYFEVTGCRLNNIDCRLRELQAGHKDLKRENALRIERHLILNRLSGIHNALGIYLNAERPWCGTAAASLFSFLLVWDKINKNYESTIAAMMDLGNGFWDTFGWLGNVGIRVRGWGLGDSNSWFFSRTVCLWVFSLDLMLQFLVLAPSRLRCSVVLSAG